MIANALTYEVSRRRWRRRAVCGFAAKRCSAARSAKRTVFVWILRLCLAAGLLAEAFLLADGAVSVRHAGSARELGGPAGRPGEVRRGLRLRFEDGAVSLFSEEEYGETLSSGVSD